MASRRYMPLTTILITICLDLSSVVVLVVAAAVAWDPKTSSRFDSSYNLDKGPVFYEAYYPDTRDAYQEKRYFDRNTVLETSFQVPAKRFTYSAESADRPVRSNNKSYVVTEDQKDSLQERRRTVEPRRDFVTFREEHPITINNDESSQTANIEEISKLVRRAISRDLENWNALERYLDRAINYDQLAPPQPQVYSGENRKITENGGYTFQVNRLDLDSSRQPSFQMLRKLETRGMKERPVYFEEVRADQDGSSPMTKMSVGNMRAADVPISLTSDSSLPENIFQPRPQIIKYTFLRKPVARPDELIKGAIDNSTPRDYGDNLIREEIANKDSREDRPPEGNVKVTSIQVSELPRHKTRHHHGEWPKRDYTTRHHRSSTN